MRRDTAEKWYGIVREWINDRDPELEELVELSELFESIATSPQRRSNANREYFDAHEKHGTEPELPDEFKPNHPKLGRTRRINATTAKGKDRGWGWPANAKKWHYFVGSESLCGNWIYGGDVYGNEARYHESDLCKKCRRELQILKTEEAA